MIHKVEKISKKGIDKYKYWVYSLKNIYKGYEEKSK